ncbi:MAG TPA: NAD(P)-dependent alcohol dehydrogenase [Patescibacteria group bacterium]|nr:NAD(P)-dependent alcohol dehydrogenase [Patescibacteria group bacterium]
MTKARAYAAQDATSPLAPISFERREVRPDDVQIDIMFCGVCHSDLHQARNDWKNSIYPMVPGHEIVGHASKVGSNVKDIKEGDLVAVGCMVDSCGGCQECKDHFEQFCAGGMTPTYNSYERDGKTLAQGGYSDVIVVKRSFVLTVPGNLDPAAAAPLLCAGITTYSPLKHWGAGPGKKVGIVGLGGLGHMGVKFARAFGAQVAVFTTSPNKREDALRLGAHEVILSKDPEDMKKHAGSFDFILDTVSAPHDLNNYLPLLKRDGTITLVGVPDSDHPPVAPFNLIFGRKRLAGSLIGGIAETQEMLDFCGEHNIVSDIEMIDIQDIEKAFTRMAKSDVKYRFVIDMKSLAA